MSDSAKDPLIGAVRAAVAASSAQAVAMRAGVSDETVYALLRGGRVGKGSRRLLEDAVKNSDRPGAAGGTRPAPEPAAPMPEFDLTNTVAIPRDQLFYWRGRLDSDIRSLTSARETLDALTESLRTLGGMFERATAGVSAFMQSGVLPAPGPNAERVTSRYTAEEGIAMLNELHAIGVAQIAQQEPAAGKRETPRRKRGVG